MENADGADGRQWHELLDELCCGKGYLDNMALAELLCAAQGNHSQAAFDAAVKNLRNWRQGVHIPQRRNFLLLAGILKVNENAGLRAEWNRLYGAAKVRPPAGIETAAPVVPPSPRPRRLPFLAAGAIAAALAAAAPLLWNGSGEAEHPDPAASFAAIEADYVRNVTVKVGDAVIIHGARGNDCGPAPSWESARVLLPDLVTGTLSDGGVGTRYSRACGGRIPARAILFTAGTAGTEQTALYGDEVHIKVTPR